MLSRKVQQVEESQTLALTAKAKQLKDSGVDVVSLTAGEPDFPTPRHVKEAAIKAIEADFTHYTASHGTPELIDAVIRKFSADNDLHFPPSQILVSAGAKHSIYNALQAICNKGDEVIILSPYWLSYPEMVRLADGTPVIVNTAFDDGFRPDIKRISRAITPRTKAIIFNSPSNPTGVVYTQSDLEEIASVIKGSGIYVISDEIYEKILYDGRSHFSIGSMKSIRDQVITVNGVSKAYAMTGWRIGYMGGPPAVIELARRVQSQATSNPTSISQKATVAALCGSQTDVETMVTEFHRRRDAVVEALSSIRGVSVFKPGGAFYIFFSIRPFFSRKYRDITIKNSSDMATYFLEQYHVALVPGLPFGSDDFLRMSYACSMRELVEGTQRIRSALEQLV